MYYSSVENSQQDERYETQEETSEPVDIEVDVIYSPYEDENEGISSAVLSVDLKDLTNFTVCFKFMVDGLADEALQADIVTFWQMLSSFFVHEQVQMAIIFQEGSFES